MRRKHRRFTSIAIILAGLMVLSIYSSANAYNPFEKPAPKPPPVTQKSSPPPKVQQPPIAPPPPQYKEELVLPKLKASNYRVLGMIDGKYIVLNLNTGNVILWGKYIVKNGCIILNGEVECYEKKKVRVR